MKDQKFKIKCKEEVGNGKVISFKYNKTYDVSSIEPGVPGEGTEDLIVIDELGNEHIVATDTERIWSRSEWFNKHFQILVIS